MTNERLWELYKVWLCSHAHIRFRRKGKYSRELIDYLHSHDFRWSIPKDRNRSEDGIYLREYFFQDYGRGSVCNLSEYRCSILEMLVALSCRIYNEYLGDPNNRHPEIIFWDLIRNLDINIDEPLKNIDAKLNIWMDRKFLYDGTGSIFPLRYPEENQRKIEIWDQMIRYIRENHHRLENY